MSRYADLRAECQRRLDLGIPGVYITQRREAMPRGAQVALAGRGSPLSFEVCTVISLPDGGHQITALFRPDAVLRFLDRVEAP